MSIALEKWDRQIGLGETIPASGVIFSGEDAVAPDIVWVRKERLEGLLDAAGHLCGAPDLVIEVLSPGRANQMRDREAKLALYSRWPVPDYWIVDWQQKKEVTVYRRGEAGLERTAIHGHDDVLTSPQLPGFACPVADIFPA